MRCIRSGVGLCMVTVAAGAAGAAQEVLTFDDLGLPVDTIITDQYASRGVLLSPQDGALRLQEASYPIFPAEPMGLAEIPYWTSVIIADFPRGAISAGAWIDFGLEGDGVKIEAFDGPGATGSLLAASTTSAEEFLGVEASGIRSVRFSNAGAARTSYLIDNFTFVVPAPGAGALVALGTLVVSRRRR
jgi:hypothetical protein